MSLCLVFVIGFAFSLLVIGFFVYFFAAYHTRDWSPWDTRPLMTTDAWFGIIRNAVTLAAALGVGITLFFSYRKQRTAEMTHRISAEAQRTAAEAQRLTAQQHINDLTKGRRERFGQAAEHLGSVNLSLAIAGAHSLEALADEWCEAGNQRERQNCIDLLCAYPSIARQHFKENRFGVTEVRAVVAARILDHISRDCAPSAYWDAKIELRDPAFLDAVSDVYVNGAHLDFRHFSPSWDKGFFRRLEIIEGSINLGEMDLNEGSLVFHDSRFGGGFVTLGTFEESHGPASLTFRDCSFSGTEFLIPYAYKGEFSLEFIQCTFAQGNFGFTERTAPRKLHFQECVFEHQIFPTSPGSWIDLTEISVQGCTTADVVNELVSRNALPQLPLEEKVST